MQPEQKYSCYDFSVEETEEGYTIHLKGNKEKVKARSNGFLTLVHKHIQAMHRHKRTHLKHREEE